MKAVGLEHLVVWLLGNPIKTFLAEEKFIILELKSKLSNKQSSDLFRLEDEIKTESC